MNGNVKKTKNCIDPWRSVQFEAGGSISPCCSGTIMGNFGNINTDYFDAIQHGQETDIFVNTAYQHLRHSLLTGNLSKSCINCRTVHEGEITTDELRQRVVNHLESHGLQTDGIDLTTTYAFSECGGNITNKCNFSCIYCSHSGENGHTGYYQREMDRSRFLDWINFLCSKGLQIFNFCGIGELTTYSGWKDLCDLLLQQHPQLRLRVISNFGKKLNDSELDTLTRFDLIHVSCDTLDDKLYAWLRKGGRLLVLRDNIHRLKKRFTGDQSRDPKLVFNVTVTDAIIDKLESLFRFAADNNMFVHLSSLFVMDGSIASRTECVKKISDMSNSQMPHIREALYDLPRRMKAQNPLTSVWEYKFLYKSIVQKADAITFNTFVPSADKVIYDLFYKTYSKDADAYLRKMWLSFDDAYKGIYIKAGKSVNIKLPYISGKISFRAVWCRDRLDGNIDITPGPIEEKTVGDEITIAADNSNHEFSHILFEVMAYQSFETKGNAEKMLYPIPPDNTHTPLLVREAFLLDEEEAVAEKLFESQEPIVIWCAGLKTLQMLSNTCLRQANIKMIIDGNPSKKGQLFCGRMIHAPEDIGDFTGKIVVIHASSPEQVAMQIRHMGIKNEVITL